VLTHYAPVYPTGVHMYTAGDSLVEGADYEHQGKNEGTEDLVLLATYVIAKGEPLAQTDLSQCDQRARSINARLGASRLTERAGSVAAASGRRRVRC